MNVEGDCSSIEVTRMPRSKILKADLSGSWTEGSKPVWIDCTLIRIESNLSSCSRVDLKLICVHGCNGVEADSLTRT